MPRVVLDEHQVHPAIRQRVASHHQAVVGAVVAALAAHPVVVVGMAVNPFPKKARAALQAAGVPHHYMAYGSYFSQWRERTALKIWSGWPTFPMVFVRGTLVGGATELDRLIASGELQTMLR